MIRTEGKNTFKNVNVLDFFKNAISKCKLRLFELLKQPHLKIFFELENLNPNNKILR